jgi:hypothetical protein
LQVSFSNGVAGASILAEGATLQLVSTGESIPFVVSMSAGGRTATLTPAAPLAAGTQYRLTVNYNYSVPDEAGVGVIDYAYFTFTTTP